MSVKLILEYTQGPGTPGEPVGRCAGRSRAGQSEGEAMSPGHAQGREPRVGVCGPSVTIGPLVYACIHKG